MESVSCSESHSFRHIWQFVSARYRAIIRDSGAVLGSGRHFERLYRKNAEDAECIVAMICLKM